MHDRRTWIAILGLTCVSVGACLPFPPAPTGPIRVELLNQTLLDVEPNLFASATAAQPWNLFKAGNLVLNFTDRPFPELRPGETVTLSYPCSDLASIGVHNPVLVDAIGIGRTTAEERVFFTVGEDLHCEATIRFTYYVEGGAFHVRATIE